MQDPWHRIWHCTAPLTHATPVVQYAAVISKLDDFCNCKSAQYMGLPVRIYKHHTQILSTHSCAAVDPAYSSEASLEEGKAPRFQPCLEGDPG